ncbi:hypothetical protein RYX36_032392, partial [Vicia faba]
MSIVEPVPRVSTKEIVNNYHLKCSLLLFHKEIIVLYVPDLCDCLPSLDEWHDQWLAHKKVVAERERQIYLKKEVNVMVEEAGCFEAGGKLCKPDIFHASTGARCFCNLGLPAIGFSPLQNTPILLHDHNE